VLNTDTLYETTLGRLPARRAYSSERTVKRLNVEHRTPNIERRILMTLRFIYFKTSESLNFEGHIRSCSAGACAACCSVFFKIDRIHYFEIRHSLFDIRFFRVSFSIRLAAFRPEATLTPETMNRFDLRQSRSPLTWTSFRPRLQPDSRA